MKTPPVVPLLAALLLSAGIAIAQPDEVVVSRIRRAPVQSTNVASVGYSRRLHALEIEFVRGAVYRFLDVPPAIYRALLVSESKGHFIAQELRGKYKFVRVRSRRTEGRNTLLAR